MVGQGEGTWWTDRDGKLVHTEQQTYPVLWSVLDPLWVVDILSTTGQTALSDRVHRVIVETVNESPTSIV